MDRSGCLSLRSSVSPKLASWDWDDDDDDDDEIVGARSPKLVSCIWILQAGVKRALC